MPEPCQGRTSSMPGPHGCRKDLWGRDFIPKLKIHLLPRIQRRLAPHPYPPPSSSGQSLESSQEWHYVVIWENRVYTQKIMQVKFTSYNIRQDKDILHLNTERSNIMVIDEGYKSGDSNHSYKYGQVIGIFHSIVMFVGPLKDETRCYKPHCLEYLWVRWYMLDNDSVENPYMLDKVKFRLTTREDAFGFIDPKRVVRMPHLIPRFAGGRLAMEHKFSWMTDYPDWKALYVNRFVDRDMFMRYQPNMGISHIKIRKQLGTNGS
ncbi:hypothetical protein FA15DRAFT_660466 [Coprinopsis marcescibilis]|uniref:Uncharacterized protein n=1 Tax=Coprinopsis marcescibilis TaxID=230819 RepID=A0A5C3KFY3_COPMA|nr:hypothetical protein FA15DRAFT_660466 [Coprinopsis marcescibilis]